MIKKLSDENPKTKITMEEIKKSHAKAIELKNCEVKNLLKLYDHQKEKMVEMEAQITKVNSSINEKLKTKNLKQHKILPVTNVVLAQAA